MKTFKSCILLSSCAALLLAGCGGDEKRNVEKLTEETQGTFPETMKESQELQQEVKILNKEVKEESRQRIEKIEKELERRKMEQ